MPSSPKQLRWKLVFVLISAAFVILAINSRSLFAQQPDSPTANEPRYWKGNLHTHSFWSDGTDFPEMIAKWYVDHDYNFLALTDHNILSRGEKWMDLETIEKRGGNECFSKYQTEFTNSVETRTTDSEKTTEVRLKTYEETRKLFEKPGQFIMIESEEISDSFNSLPIHMNSLNLRDLLKPTGGQSVRETIRSNLRAANEQAKKLDREILVHLNHPNFGWAITPEDLAAVLEEQFFEIFNGHPGVNQLGDETHPSLEQFWDVVNALRIEKLDSPPAYGLGVDDSHEFHGRAGSRPGRAWVMVRSSELKTDALINAMKEGDFYSSSGVVLSQIEFDQQSKTLSIQIQGVEGVEYSTQFVGTRKGFELWEPDSSDSSDQKLKQNASENNTSETNTSKRNYSSDIGQVLETHSGTSVSYQLTGEELYVRAIIISNRAHPDPSFDNQFEQAWTQPFGWR